MGQTIPSPSLTAINYQYFPHLHFASTTTSASKTACGVRMRSREAVASGAFLTRNEFLHFDNVVLAGIGVSLPEEIWTSAEIEERLEPLYQRLRLPTGRLSLMSGIGERRVWPEGTLPSGPSVASAAAAIEGAGIDRDLIGCLVHASVCRDFLEPATASRVHHRLGLRHDCWVYDVSNACLGILNGAVQIAVLIEQGIVEGGIVVGTENSRPLLTQTIRHLNAAEELTRQTVKPAFASLTIGSGSCAWLLTHRRHCPQAASLHTACATARTAYHDLCLSPEDSAGAQMAPLMDTDSERLMAEGIATGVENFEALLAETAWRREDLDVSICHQVGGRHRTSMLAAMGLPVEKDVVTFPWLGNTGSVALPITLAAAVRYGALMPGARAGLFGIGSGINSVMLGCRWGATPVVGNFPPQEPAPPLE